VPTPALAPNLEPGHQRDAWSAEQQYHQQVVKAHRFSFPQRMQRMCSPMIIDIAVPGFGRTRCQS
jgi:hypothetical protein